MFRPLLIASALCMIAGSASAADPQFNRKQMEEAQRMMNSPEYKAQMQEAMKEMRKQGMDTSAMENMPAMNPKAMEAAMGMNDCMEKNVGQEGMQRIADESKAHQQKVNALCKAGKHAQAEAEQKAYVASMATRKEYKGMRTCAEKYKDAMKDPAFAGMKQQMQDMDADAPKGICG